MAKIHGFVPRFVGDGSFPIRDLLSKLIGNKHSIDDAQTLNPLLEIPLKLTAACAFGLEAIVKRELIALGYEPKVTSPGRISFEGDWVAVCRTNYWLRTADRVLIEVQSFDSPDFDALFDTVKDYDWSQFLPADAEFPVVGKSRHSQLTSVPAVQRTVKKALVESLKKHHGVAELPETGELYKVEIALLNDLATLTIDTTGASLHKRGYRKLVGDAPIKETLAAAMVNLSVWNPERPLIDPFCGSGTIPIEAALIGTNVAPGLYRQFACSAWDAITTEDWSHAMEEAQDSIRRDLRLHIVGSDRDKEALSLARYHSKQAGVADQVHFQHKPFEEIQSNREYGVVITNPPYGERLDDQQRLIGLYESIPGIIQRLPTWSLFLITNMPKFESMIQKKATRRRKLFNGRLECTYYQFLGPRPPKKQPEIELADTEAPSETETTGDDGPASVPAGADLLTPVATPPSSNLPTTLETQAPDATDGGDQLEQVDSIPEFDPDKPVALFGGLQAKDHEQAELFRNRLQKRAKHLRRWPTKRGVTCFRLYERDIPEIPLVVDRYGDYLHVTEYDRPHERDLARHSAWLDLMKQTAASTLDVPLAQTHLKKRRKSQDSRQYEKIASTGRLVTVNEGGLKFLINLTDYVDTGLFLDHRETREMVRKEAQGKDFLNLFAYTGSFSVYAASGGASSTATVDLSNNYLDWAKQNMEVNGLTSVMNRFIPADSIEFLDEAAGEKRQRFDLAMVDPPTFSNSKKTEEDWEVQSRHVELLSKVHEVMRMKGVVYFSTNFRRFKFDEEALGDLFEIREISKQTVPEDFRNRRIHRCWRLVVKWD
ncbi:MAG: 23S rRNA (guanine2445-N2)-methyltransferase / 23S rRNA (guanine2069-N7)-methyltransferase [Mariniblastus sp.]